MLDAVNRMTETETGEEIFSLLKNSLISLDKLELLGNQNISLSLKEGARGSFFKYWFFLRLLNILGYKFEFDRCVSCNLKLDRPVQRVFFSVNSGGIVCNICRRDASLKNGNFSDGIFLDYDLFLLIKKLSLSSNFSNNILNFSLDEKVRNKMTFFMNKVIDHFLALINLILIIKEA